MRTWLATLVLAALAATSFRHAGATDFTVDDPGFASDNNAGNGACATAGGVCTLHAAIQESNALAGSHTISFNAGIMALTPLGADIPDIIAPIVINGTNSNGATGNRVEIDANNRDCFDFDETNTMAHPTGARGSTLANFVIRNCSGDGVDLSGHGYTVSGNRIGTNGAGTASDINNDANGGDGISISGTIPPPALPDISGIIANPPANFGAIVAFAASISGALTAIASPTFITTNLISGNSGDGIELFTPMTVNVQINTNIIGLDVNTVLALPNGRGGGDAAGIRLTGSGYGNFIGPANIISGQTEPGDNGIVIQPGEVLLPNFIMGNLVGLGATQVLNVGNAESGIVVDTRPDTTMPGVNPTGFSLFLGPANTVSDNQGTNAADPDTVGGDTAAGIVIANSSGVRVYGNQIGAFAFPAGGTPIGSLDTGNAGDGIIVVNSPQVQIGGSEVFEGNLVLRNAKHGILVRGTGTNGTIIRNNFVGVSIDDLDVFDFANGADGLHINASGRIEIGGTGNFDDNVIAGNGRHGIAMRNGGPTQGWANHMQRNQIYRNTGLAIDHNVTEEAPDPTDNTPDQDPNDTFYTNYGQNAPVLTTINGAVQYTFQSANSRQYRIDVYQDTSAGITAATAEARTWIAETTIMTNGTGAFTGSVAAPSGGGFVTVTATDISPSNDLPGPPPAPDPGPHNNTSELSNALQLIEYTVSDPSVAEGAAATTTMLTFVVTRSSSTGTGSVDVATANGSATTGDSDYVALGTTTVPFADGQASANVQVTVNGDAKFEPDETVLLDLSNPMNGTIADNQGVGTITNDDTQPAIAIGDVMLAEGTGGASTAFTFAVTLSNPSSQTITVSAQSALGGATPATPGVDYTALGATTVTFVPDDVSENVTVQVTHDAMIETDETFVVNLSAQTNATIGDPQGLGTITNDDGLTTPDVTITDLMLAEGSGGGNTVFAFTVTLSAPSAAPVVVNYMTADGSATTADADYTAETASIQIDPPMVTGQITIDVAADNRFEADETFVVNLTGATGGNITDNQATGTVQNDDAMPSITVNDPMVVEGNAGTAMLTYTVSLSAASGLPVTVNAASADGSATIADNDYVTLASTPVNFAPGVTTQPVAVTVNGDTKFEPPESVQLNLSGATGATIGDPQGNGTIQNDDSLPTVAISDLSQAEGNAGNTPFTFNVTLSNAAAFTTIYTYTLADGSATIADNDYVTSSGMITFAPDDTAETVTVMVVGDTTDEPNETFFVNLMGGSLLEAKGGPPDDLQAVGTILNDDSLVSQFSIADASVAEGNAGTAQLQFTVSRTSTFGAASVDVVSADGSATTADADYVALPLTTVNFADGVASQMANVTVNGDTKFELDDQLTLTLSNPLPMGASILDGSATGTILNDDLAPAISIADASAAEGNAGNAPLTFAVTLSNPSFQTITVTAQSADGSAMLANNDYAALAATTVTFVPGDVAETVTVNAIGDVAVEPDETFSVTLSNEIPVQGVTIADGSATGTITNDDAAGATFAINDVTLAEGNAGTTAFTFTVTRAGSLVGSVSVDVSSAAGGATPATGGGVDYTGLATTTLSFANGVATQTATVQVSGETTFEPDETFVMNLANAVGGTIIDPQGLGTITNDDPQPTISVADLSAAEGNAGSSTFPLVVSLSNPSSQTITVTLTVTAGSAAPPGDYTALGPVTVTFAPGVTQQTVMLSVVGDTVAEGNETLTTTLSGPANATILDGSGLVTIVDDDAGTAPGAPTPVPTLAPWLVAALALLLGLIGAHVARRQPRAQRR